MVNTARPEATLRYLKPASFAENQVGVRHAHMVKVDLGVAVGGVVVPEREQEETHRFVVRWGEITIDRFTYNLKSLTWLAFQLCGGRIVATLCLYHTTRGRGVLVQ